MKACRPCLRSVAANRRPTVIPRPDSCTTTTARARLAAPVFIPATYHSTATRSLAALPVSTGDGNLSNTSPRRSSAVSQRTRNGWGFQVSPFRHSRASVDDSGAGARVSRASNVLLPRGPRNARSGWVWVLDWVWASGGAAGTSAAGSRMMARAVRRLRVFAMRIMRIMRIMKPDYGGRDRSPSLKPLVGRFGGNAREAVVGCPVASSSLRFSFAECRHP